MVSSALKPASDIPPVLCGCGCLQWFTPRKPDARFMSGHNRRAASTAFGYTETDGCWLWTGPVNSFGYPVWTPPSGWLKRRGAWLVHRLMYKLEHGALTPGMEVDHVCRNRLCINPEHLEEIGARLNQIRMQIAVYLQEQYGVEADPFTIRDEVNKLIRIIKEEPEGSEEEIEEEGVPVAD